MTLNINEMRSQLVGGGASPTTFQVIMQNPVNNSSDLKAPFMIKASSLPPSSMGIIEVPYMGRKIKVKGNRTFPEWTVTVINDEDFLIRNAMEEWMSAMNGHETNVSQFGTTNPNEYKSQAQIVQYSKNGNVLREYSFNGLFPSEISEIDMNWESTDTIQEFNVTFQYDWWDISRGITGDGGT